MKDSIRYEICGFRREFPNGRCVEVDSLEILEKEIIAVVGVSGSGKSTLVAAMGGLIPSSGSVSGSIKYYGGDAEDPIEVLDNPKSLFREKAGFIFQHSNLLKEQTTSSNIVLSVKHIKRRPTLKKMITTAEKLSLTQENLIAKVRTLSGGEAQRVALLRVLIRDPDIIIADEPTASLDPDVADDVMQVLSEWAKGSGKVLIWVTHDLEAVIKYAKHCIYMRDGKLIGESVQECPETSQEIREIIGKPKAKDVETKGIEDVEFPRPGFQYILNQVFNSKLYDKSKVSNRFVQWLNFAPNQERVDRGRLATFFQSFVLFGLYGPVLIGLSVILLIAAFYMTNLEVEAKTSQTLRGPTLSNVVVTSPDDFSSGFLEDFRSELEVAITGEDAIEEEQSALDVEMEEPVLKPRRVFGRYEAPLQVRQAIVQSIVKPNGEESITVECGSASTKIDTDMLVVESAEPGIEQLTYLQGGLISELSKTEFLDRRAGALHTALVAPLYPDINDELFLPGAIVTAKALRKVYAREPAASVPAFICLSIADDDPEPFRISGIVESISIASAAGFSAVISHEIFREHYENVSRVPQFKRIAVYVNSDNPSPYYSFFTGFRDEVATFEKYGQILFLEHGFNKLKEAINATVFYRTAIRYIMLVSIALVATIIGMQAFFQISRNSASFLVARAFGLGLQNLIWYSLAVVLISVIISALLAFGIGGLIELYGWQSRGDLGAASVLGSSINTWGIPVGAVIYSILIGVIATLTISLVSTSISVIIWWIFNKSIHDGIRM